MVAPKHKCYELSIIKRTEQVVFICLYTCIHVYMSTIEKEKMDIRIDLGGMGEVAQRVNLIKIHCMKFSKELIGISLNQGGFHFLT